jgi:hypothetical protein
MLMSYNNRFTRIFRISAIAAACSAMIVAGMPAFAQDANAILRAMSNYVASQKAISLTFDTEIEVVTPEQQKIQFASSGQLSLSRPNMFRASRTGGYADVELIADGKTVTLLGKHSNVYAQVPLSGSIDEIIDQLRTKYGADLPAADLLSANAFAALTEGVTDAKHIGQGVINGVECEHLAFRTKETDWQIWIQVGNRPIPRKYVITSKDVAGAPQYTVRIKDWKTDAKFSAGTFAFKPPSGANKIDISALRDFDEVPASAASK